jgi:hypothetical protein
VLRPETVRLMGENAMGDLDVWPLKTAIPAYSHDAEFFPGMVKEVEPRLHDLDRGGARWP